MTVQDLKDKASWEMKDLSFDALLLLGYLIVSETVDEAVTSTDAYVMGDFAGDRKDKALIEVRRFQENNNKLQQPMFNKWFRKTIAWLLWHRGCAVYMRAHAPSEI
tara:strand:- start:39 stop:356 length:318 start_codon:yes stop_codon:yes gene_type:complete